MPPPQTPTKPTRPIKIAASLLAADALSLGAAAAQAAHAGVDALHIDIMDGHFVPPIEGSARLVAALKAACALPLQVHLMVADPTRCVDAFIAAGASSITVHIEAVRQVGPLLAHLRAAGVGAGLSLCPDTCIWQLRPHLQALDQALVMSVQPGFGGQAFMPESLAKVRQLRAWQSQMDGQFCLAVDGGIDARCAAALGQAGAQLLVAGSALWPKKLAAAAPHPPAADAAAQRIAAAVGELRAAAHRGQAVA